jgi:hydrogenase-4 component B
MTSFLVGVLLFPIGGLVAAFFKVKFKAIAFAIISFVAQFFLLPVVLQILVDGGQIEKQLSLSEPIGISFLRIDPLAAFFVFIVSLGALFTAVYSIGYMKMYLNEKAKLSSYYFFLGLMTSSMLLVAVVQNALLFMIAWELMSLSSFFLVSFDHKNEEVRKAGIYYLIAMQIGAAFLIAAFGWSSAISGSLDFLSFKNLINSTADNSVLIFVLFFFGFGVKAGFVPLHTWLPKAHPAAPTGVSALMSGVMIKMGIYGILRILLLLGIPDIRLAYSVLALSIFTGIYGIANAIGQQDLKKLLAFSSIENVGIIGMGIGIGMLGIALNNQLIAFLGFLGALLHTINHFIFKSVLFYGAGAVYKQIHTRNIEKMGGLVKFMPFTSLLFLIASMAITGLPILNGFVSEFALYLGLLKSFSLDNLTINIAALVGITGLSLIGALALICFTKVYGICFLGNPRSVYNPAPKESELTILVPTIFLAIGVFVIGLYPVIAINLLARILGQFVTIDISTSLSETLSIITVISTWLMVFIAFIAVVLIVRTLLLRKKIVSVFKTWDCGYQTESSRLQYTGSSFAQPFLQLAAELVPQKIEAHKEQALFPAQASFKSHSQDFSERLLIQPSIKFLNNILNRFSWIQSGKMQEYILYGLIFLVTLLIWIWGNK